MTAIPLNEEKKSVCEAFARAPYFMLKADAGVGIEKNPAADAAGGAGPKAAQFLIDRGVRALITFRCGENAGRALKAAGCAVYKAEKAGAEENIELFEGGKLSLLSSFHAGFQGGA